MVPQHFALAAGEQLTIRQPAPAEIADLAAFIAATHESPALGAWARDALSGRHPAVAPDDAVIAAAADGRIVGSVVLIPQCWQYGPIPLPVGQLEAIGVAPGYRRRGLARALIGAAHGLSAARGHLLQAIVGPPHLYRRFGYSYALRFRGGRVLPVEVGLPAPDGPVVRPAAMADIPALVALGAATAGRLLLRPALDAARWAYDLDGHHPDSDAAMRIDLVCGPDGAPLAYGRSFPTLWDGELAVVELAVAEEAAAVAAAALVADWRARFGEALTRVAWELEPSHPLFIALDGQLGPPRRPSAWYLRAPDLPALLAQISPALAGRLAGSAVGAGSIVVSTYTDGLQIALGDAGVTVTPWDGPWHEADAAIPPDALIQLLTGYRGLPALLDSYPDLVVSPPAETLLAALFPAQDSHVVPLG